jgi:hypothetical protein
MEGKLKPCSLVPKKKGMGASKWDLKKFIKLNLKWSQYIQIKKGD